MQLECTVALALVRLLKSYKVDVIFSLSGNQIMPIYDGCFEEELEIVHCRHEGAAVFMADGYSQISNRPGVAMVTAGAGFLNSLGALFAAKLNHSNIILITGDSSLSQDGRGAFQELDQCSVSSPLTSLSLRPKSPEQLFSAFHRAFQGFRNGVTGPVHFALAADLLEKKLTDSDSYFCQAPFRKPNYSEQSSLYATLFEDKVYPRLRSSEAPIIILGPFFNEARYAGVTSLIKASLGVECFFMESPRGVSDPHWPGLSEKLAAADFILSIGKPIDFSVKFGSVRSNEDSSPEWFLVDTDELALERSHTNLKSQTVYTLRMSPQKFLDGLLERVRSKTRLTKISDGRNVASVGDGRNETDSLGGPCGAHSDYFRVLQSTIDGLGGKTTLVIDGGEFGQWAQASLRASRRVINGISGTIGGGVSYGIGAFKANPSSHVIVLVGDGTAGFHLAEFETAAREGIRIVTIIGNDHRWNAEFQIQIRKYGKERTFACELSDARYAEACIALGGFGAQVTTPKEFHAALTEALAFDGPSCIDMAIEPIPFGTSSK